MYVHTCTRGCDKDEDVRFVNERMSPVDVVAYCMRSVRHVHRRDENNKFLISNYY